MKIRAECFLADDPDSPTRYASFEVSDEASTERIQDLINDWKEAAFWPYGPVEGAWWVEGSAMGEG